MKALGAISAPGLGLRAVQVLRRLLGDGGARPEAASEQAGNAAQKLIRYDKE